MADLMHSNHCNYENNNSRQVQTFNSLLRFVILFVYQKALLQTFIPVLCLQNNLCEFTAQEHKFR